MADEREQTQAVQRDPMWDVGDVAAYLKCTPAAVRYWVHNDTIPYHKVGRLVRFRRAEIDAWVASQRESQTESGSPREDVA